MKVIGVTGLPGSGKSVVSRVAKKLDIPLVRMGDVIREEAKKRNQTTGEIAVELRKEYGDFIVAERCVETHPRAGRAIRPSLRNAKASSAAVWF